MRVAFVEDILRFSIPLGIPGIAAALREGGHEVEVFVANKLEKTFDEIETYAPDFVAFSVISGSHIGYYAIARSLKERLGVLTMWGGPHPTFFPEMIEFPWVDAVCRGEGEEAVVKFADAFDGAGAFEIVADGLLQQSLILVEVEMHGLYFRGRPRMRSAMMLRWIWFVPA